MNHFSHLPKCLAHGVYVGNQCPLCPAGTPSESGPEPVPPVDPYSEKRDTWWKGPEREWHEMFAQWCSHHQIEIVHSRMDEKSTIEKGFPDFVCIYTAEDGITRCCLIEAKNWKGRLSRDQDRVIARLRERSVDVLVTGDFSEACEYVRARLLLRK